MHTQHTHIDQHSITHQSLIDETAIDTDKQSIPNRPSTAGPSINQRKTTDTVAKRSNIDQNRYKLLDYVWMVLSMQFRLIVEAFADQHGDQNLKMRFNQHGFFVSTKHSFS